MLTELRSDLGRVLVGDEPEVELRGRFGGQHRLGTWSLVTGRHTGDVAGRSEEHPLDDLPHFGIADKVVESDELLALVDLGVDLRHHAAVGLGRLDDLVVEPVDPDVHVLVAQTRERTDHIHRRRRVDGPKSRMLVEVEQLHTQLYVEQAATSELDGRPSRVVEGGARFPQASVRGKLSSVLVRDLLEGLGSDLFLALDQEAQCHRQGAQRLQRFEGVDPSHHVRFVIGDPASDDPPILLNRFEGRRGPQVDRVHRLDVVVLVEQQRAASGSGHLRVKRGHASGVQRLHAVGETRKTIANPFARRLDSLAPVVGDARE